MSEEITAAPDWQPGQPLRIETERFFLRSLTPDDATITYVSWWNDPEVQAGLNSRPRRWDKQRAIQHIAQFDNFKGFHLGIFCRDTGRMIGFFAAFPNPNTKVAKTNVVIGEKDFWGKHVVQEVRPPMLDFLFQVMGMEKVKGEIRGRNYPSIFNYKAMGFTCEGILRKDLVHYSGEGRADVFLFGLLREEWEAQQAAAANNE
jgi:RimJ/RimL family protein N-acetyltransferase